jgi:hypothetical protein
VLGIGALTLGIGALTLGIGALTLGIGALTLGIGAAGVVVTGGVLGGCDASAVLTAPLGGWVGTAGIVAGDIVALGVAVVTGVDAESAGASGSIALLLSSGAEHESIGNVLKIKQIQDSKLRKLISRSYTEPLDPHAAERATNIDRTTSVQRF